MTPARDRFALRSLRLLPFVALASAASGQVLALTDEEIFREFRFNFINPGARSLALGGAFISLADDATAAQANPAGLAYLLKPEYFVEMRAVDNGGEVTSIQQSLLPARFLSVASGTNLDDVRSVSFASFVRPLGRATLGVSRQEILRSESSTLNSLSVTFTSPPGAFSVRGTGLMDVRLSSYNASLGARIGDRFSIGASLVLSSLQVRSRVANLVSDTDAYFALQPIPSPTLDTVTRIDDEDAALGVTLGAIYRPSEPLSFGAVARRAPRFVLTETVERGIDVFQVGGRLGRGFRNEFDTPDSYGAGASWRPHPRLTLALEVDLIEYSQLTRNFVSGVNALAGAGSEFRVDDATDVHLGGEWVLILPRSVPLALRGGVLTRSDNTIRAERIRSRGLGGIGFFSRRAKNTAFPGGDHEVRWAAGLGLARDRLKIDLGIDVGESSKEFVASFIFQGK